MNILPETKKRMQAQIDHFIEELKGLRAGRATPALIEPVTVEVYGAQMRIKELATITSPEPRQLVINPFDQIILAPLLSPAIRAGIKQPVQHRQKQCPFNIKTELAPGQ